MKQVDMKKNARKIEENQHKYQFLAFWLRQFYFAWKEVWGFSFHCSKKTEKTICIFSKKIPVVLDKHELGAEKSP